MRQAWFDVRHRWRWQRATSRAWFAVGQWQRRRRQERGAVQMQAEYAAARDSWWRQDRQNAAPMDPEQLKKAMDEAWRSVAPV